ncbi:uncharacterized protein MYCFIDRAFT_179311 [Pseudocercospora fijiensis CIRAD86]|uniref:Uncharacterized protein n=1 Tax=Pseudocercospora fijiensis (strain CIRAD86) TaxID=383855 RepID=M3AK55_PSEFD|nr:uncharacterized protein MYCFIDRAFT_179311 [Pseudocercospora fijiensis CIRAD86]EME77832.1 hypothetical protein MYCFIDRAFT_179311 [Pseudocercospora fijiensis CIRAD86]
MRLGVTFYCRPGFETATHRLAIRDFSQLRAMIEEDSREVLSRIYGQLRLRSPDICRPEAHIESSVGILTRSDIESISISYKTWCYEAATLYEISENSPGHRCQSHALTNVGMVMDLSRNANVRIFTVANILLFGSGARGRAIYQPCMRLGSRGMGCSVRSSLYIMRYRMSPDMTRFLCLAKAHQNMEIEGARPLASSLAKFKEICEELILYLNATDRSYIAFSQSHRSIPVGSHDLISVAVTLLAILSQAQADTHLSQTFMLHAARRGADVRSPKSDRGLPSMACRADVDAVAIVLGLETLPHVCVGAFQVNGPWPMAPTAGVSPRHRCMMTDTYTIRLLICRWF